MITPLPHSAEAEMSVLGSVLLDNKALPYISSILESHQFYIESNRLVYESMKSLADKGQSIDLVLLREELLANDSLVSVGGLDYLTTLSEIVPTASNCEYYSKIVRDNYVKRRAIRGAQEVIEKAQAGKPLADVKDSLSDLAKDILITSAETKKFSMKSDMMDYLQNLDSEEIFEVFPTGFPSLDRLLDGGYQRQQVYILAGRPSMGKTTIMMNMLKHSLLCGRRSLFFSQETKKEKLRAMLLASETGINTKFIERKRNLTDQMKRDIIAAGGRLFSNGDYHVVDKCGVTAEEVRAEVTKHCMSNELDIVWVDHLHLMNTTKGLNKADAIGEITKTLKQIARDFDCAVVLLSQLNRANESRENKRPRMSDLRGSGDIEQDADAVLLVYREGYYTGDKGDSSTEIIIGKNRFGETMTVYLDFKPTRATFESRAVDGSF